jgi:hypothetical protein
MNDTVNNAFRLPLSLSNEKLEHDLAICLRENWKEHFNTRDYSGEWSVIALRSQTGKAQDIYAQDSQAPFADTALMEKCNYFREIVNAFQFEKESVRLLRLKPGSVIHEHRDIGLAYRFDCFRLHIPVRTDAAVAFLVGGADLPMQKGECWYADFDLPHSVKNDSKEERIHLVIDGKRNAWTDEFFRSAGYDFELEKEMLKPKYDDAMIDGMIEGLEKIGTETSRKMIADLLAQKKSPGNNRPQKKAAVITKEHIPSSFSVKENALRFRWVKAGDKRFTEPFFQETILACKSFVRKREEIIETSAEEFLAAAKTVDAVEPSAFIFHISRCGSTLLSQLFATNEQYIVLSEAPLLDDLLRLPYNTNSVSEEDSDALFKAAIRLYARRYTGKEKHLIIKCDSWHTLFYERIRRCFPNVPFILLYRSPVEVVRSQAKTPGMQIVPGFIQPEIFGFDAEAVLNMQKETYFGKVLEKYFESYLEILRKDPLAFPLSYHDGPKAMFETMLATCGFAADEELVNAAAERSRYHSKYPTEVFSEENAQQEEPEYLKKAVLAFREISSLVTG